MLDLVKSSLTSKHTAIVYSHILAYFVLFNSTLITIALIAIRINIGPILWSLSEFLEAHGAELEEFRRDEFSIVSRAKMH